MPFGVVLQSSPFYAEAGGQTNDVGQLEVGGVTVDVVDVQSYGGFLLHTCLPSALSSSVTTTTTNGGGGGIVVGTQAEARVDYAFRRRVAPNHTMTHALNFALRKVVSAEVDQKGSSVTDEKLRFDFNAKKALTPQQLLEVEKLLNELVQAGVDVSTQMVPLDEAKSINGLRAVFGETYPDPVRVVSVGQAVGDLLASPSSPEWMDNSIEFCGGTHLQNTRDAVACCLVEEAAVAKGIRRISAITGPAAERALQEGVRLQSRLEAIAAMLSRCDDDSNNERASRR